MEMVWIVRTPVEDGVQCLYAGWEKPGSSPGLPARVDGWSLVLKVTSQDGGKTEGRVIFPEQADFEFSGSFAQLVTRVRQAEGGRVIFFDSDMTTWMD